MAKLHLTKVAVGCRDSDALAERIESRSIGSEVRIATRMRPKRATELVGGNLYWIVRHRIVAFNEILRFEDRDDGRIDIVCRSDLICVAPTHRRAHQGWRYLAHSDAPSRSDDGTGLSRLPPSLYGRLAALAIV